MLDRGRVRRRLGGVVLIVSGGELGGQFDDAGPVQMVEPCGLSGCDEEEVQWVRVGSRIASGGAPSRAIKRVTNRPPSMRIVSYRLCEKPRSAA
jgi:hypothetical protein